VVCDYNGKQYSDKEGKAAYEATPPDAMGYMFTLMHRGTPLWIDATAERPDRLINHSKCHDNVCAVSF